MSASWTRQYSQLRAKQEAGTDRRSAVLEALVREIASLRAQLDDGTARGSHDVRPLHSGGPDAVGLGV